MDVLSERRRALMGGDRNGMVNGTYYNQDQTGSIVVSGNNTTTLTGSITTAGVQVPLKKPVQAISECYVYQTYNSYITTIGVRFYFSDNTSVVVTKTSGDISSDPNVHFAIPGGSLGKTLVGFGFGSAQEWVGQTITWSMVVDGESVF